MAFNHFNGPFSLPRPFSLPGPFDGPIMEYRQSQHLSPRDEKRTEKKTDYLPSAPTLEALQDSCPADVELLMSRINTSLVHIMDAYLPPSASSSEEEGECDDDIPDIVEEFSEEDIPRFSIHYEPEMSAGPQIPFPVAQESLEEIEVRFFPLE